jgi:hypothetical protein
MDCDYTGISERVGVHVMKRWRATEVIIDSAVVADMIETDVEGYYIASDVDAKLDAAEEVNKLLSSLMKSAEKRGVDKSAEENIILKATIERISKLPEKWRNTSNAYWDVGVGNHCASGLQEAINNET